MKIKLLNCEGQGTATRLRAGRSGVRNLAEVKGFDFFPLFRSSKLWKPTQICIRQVARFFPGLMRTTQPRL